MRVPQSFVVPEENGWAAGARGLSLGSQVNTLRQRKKNGAMPHADIAQLDALRFVWSIPEWPCIIRVGRDRCLVALAHAR